MKQEESVVHKEQAIKGLFSELSRASRFRDVKETVFKTGVFRYDVRLMFGIYARFILDPNSRINDLVLVGYIHDGKFTTLNHFDYKLQFNKRRPKEEAKLLEKYLFKLIYEFRHRVEHLEY